MSDALLSELARLTELRGPGVRHQPRACRDYTRAEIETASSPSCSRG